MEQLARQAYWLEEKMANFIRTITQLYDIRLFTFLIKYQVFDNFAVQIKVGGEDFVFTLVDTAGQEGFDELRGLTYPGTDVFIICFSVVSSDSFSNVAEKAN